MNSTPLKDTSPPLGVPLPPSFSLFVRCSSRCFISLLRDVFGVDRGQRLPRCPWFPRGSPVVRRAGSPVFVPCSKSARENLCSDGGKVEGFRPRVYAPLFSSVRLLFAVWLLCGFCAALFSGFGPDRVRARYFHSTAVGCQAPGSPGGMPPRVSVVRPLFNAFLFTFPLCSYFRLCGPARPSCGFRQRVTDRRPGRARSGRREDGGACFGSFGPKKTIFELFPVFLPGSFFLRLFRCK